MVSRITGVDLSKILGGSQNIWGQRVAITFEITGISQFLGARARAPQRKDGVSSGRICKEARRSIVLVTKDRFEVDR